MLSALQDRFRFIFKRNKPDKIPYKPQDALNPDEIWRFTGRPVAWVFAVIHKNRGKFILALLMDLVFAMLAMIPSIVIGRLVDEVFENRNYTNLVTFLILMVAIPLVRNLMMYFFRHIFEDISLDAMMNVRHALYRHLQGMDSTFYTDTPTGNLMANLTNDLENIRHFLAFAAFAAIENIFLFVVGIIYLLYISLPLALITGALTPLIFFVVRRFAKVIHPVWSSWRQAYEGLNTVVQENIGGNRTVRAFVRQDYEIERFEKENVNFQHVNHEAAETRSKYIPVLDGLANLMSVPVIMMGGILVIRGSITLGDLVTFNSLLFVLANPTRQIGFRIDEIQRFSTSADKIIDLLSAKARIFSPADADARTAAETTPGQHTDDKWLRKRDEEISDNLEIAPLKGEVEFRNVTFRYAGLNRPAKYDTLKNINLKVSAGQTVGIMGSTGSGKTTLAHLIPRLGDPSEGQVLIDGTDVREYNLQALRRNIGVVTQDVFLFSDSVANNIAYGRPALSDEDLEAAAAAAQAAEFIPRMDDGYETVIGERGTGLSGGQKQRLSLARALAIRPAILILDDTTSAVDMETDKNIRDSLKDIAAGQTVFMIASRISSVRHADIILIMDHGEIAERGTHDELIARRGLYYDIFQTQMGQVDTTIEDIRKAGDFHGQA